MFLYIQYPSWIHPEIFPGIQWLSLLRWYGLMYVFAFSTAYFILKKVSKEGALNTQTYKITEDDLFSFIATGILFLLLGARIFSTLIYNTYDPSDPTSINYWTHPWLIFWPFDSSMNFTGFAGMSYHGGFVGGLLGMIFWCKRHKQPVAKWIDAMVCAIPLGYTFGRIGNFMNGELYGRITTAPWGMIFKVPRSERFDPALQWVQDFAAQIGMDISTQNLVNLPRHPSQLYEALFEGLILWLIIWLCRNHKKFDGMLSCIYTGGYGIFRFVIEYFREPDADLGYRIGTDTSAPIYTNTSLLNFSTGQILCFLMIIGSIIAAILLYRNEKKKAAQVVSKNQKNKKPVKK
ncbi:MAG: prolipoprotein diacylglyceryl transferase [Treponema sp.]|nr:prolipoprotein diacylglyceryl transferase [Treponema sp.]